MIRAGVDEVGRGPLAGPVIAAAVVLPHRYRLDGLADSKTLSPRKRAILDRQIKQQALFWGIGRAEVREVDELNVFRASLLAMKRAVEALGIDPDVSLIDGKWAPELACETVTIVGGDAKEPAISAASIVAKVTRDAEMCDLEVEYPGHGFGRNKGYATAQHLAALKRVGVCKVHRKSFAPVRRQLQTQLTLGVT